MANRPNPYLVDADRRITFSEIWISLAGQLARRSTCQRASVGCVITSADSRYVMAVGYNGGAAGEPHGCDDATAPGACGCLHAEDNAVINCTADRDRAKLVYVSTSPCLACAKRLVNLGGVVRVIYANRYRDATGIALLERRGIQIVQA